MSNTLAPTTPAEAGSGTALPLSAPLAPPLATPATAGVAARPQSRAGRRVLWLLLWTLVLLIVAGGALGGYVVSNGGWYQPLQTLPAQQVGPMLDVKPEGVYVVVDTHANILRVYKDGQLLRQAVCSTGSGTVLRDPRNGKTWVFDTPLGERKVEKKQKDPIWYKPDWAFIEEGTLPPKNPAERADDISLGKYGLYLGDGYIIHGTIFQSLLGRRLTHGCIRLGDDDLEFVYNNVPKNSRVYLY